MNLLRGQASRKVVCCESMHLKQLIYSRQGLFTQVQHPQSLRKDILGKIFPYTFKVAALAQKDLSPKLCIYETSFYGIE